jgi:hypothetical protein
VQLLEKESSDRLIMTFFFYRRTTGTTDDGKGGVCLTEAKGLNTDIAMRT